MEKRFEPLTTFLLTCQLKAICERPRGFLPSVLGRISLPAMTKGSV